MQIPLGSRIDNLRRKKNISVEEIAATVATFGTSETTKLRFAVATHPFEGSVTVNT